MSIDNLMLTEHAIKRHAKRLQKQMKNYNQDITLGESQTLLSKILGFNDWNHLNTILKPAIESKNLNIVNDSTLSNKMAEQKIFQSITSEEGIQIFIGLLKKDNTLFRRCLSLFLY